MSGITGRRRIAAREFTDRIDPREAFWIRFNKMLDENHSTFITYYGAGGVGKSSLPLDVTSSKMQCISSMISSTAAIIDRSSIDGSSI